MDNEASRTLGEPTSFLREYPNVRVHSTEQLSAPRERWPKLIAELSNGDTDVVA